MSRQLKFMAAARLELETAYDWYEREAAGLGEDLAIEVGHQVERIAINPLQFPIVHRDIRRVRLRRFPYALFFRSDHDAIYVIACLHASRDPMIWRRRS